tara:strand:+ start:477 stop:644 length:168 start_codon:yes stop_codon:yes gene_type:complete
MIEKAEIVGPYEMTGRECNHYVYIQFCDGSSISLNEEELKSAAILAGMGRLIENE